MSASFTLKQIAPTTFSQGGWTIDHDYSGNGSLRLALFPGGAKDITLEFIKRLPSISASKGLSSEQLQLLLWNVSKMKLWGKNATAHLLAVSRSKTGKITYEYSTPAQFCCPVFPINVTGVEVGSINSVRRFGQSLKDQEIPYEKKASLLMPVDTSAIQKSKYMFFHSSFKPTTSASLTVRGTNCITFLDTALGCNSNNLAGRDGSYIADKCNGRMIKKDVKGPAMREFFSHDNKKAWSDKAFVFWWEIHCAVIVDGTVCEYSRTKKEYVETPVHDYLKPFNNADISLAEIS